MNTHGQKTVKMKLAGTQRQFEQRQRVCLLHDRTTLTAVTGPLTRRSQREKSKPPNARAPGVSGHHSSRKRIAEYETLDQ